MFGGSIGIAAATAILAVKERSRITGLGASAELIALGSSIREAIRNQTHFQRSCGFSAVIPSIAFLFPVATYRKNKPILQDRMLVQCAEADRQTQRR